MKTGCNSIERYYMLYNKDTEIPYSIDVMGIVLVTGGILKGEGIQWSLPPEPHRFMVEV
tara:strand:+ start:937 stop:1113 length:177 start_codon:yes stop_codon:yes gene_type:complete